jgi:hypothetical protein
MPSTGRDFIASPRSQKVSPAATSVAPVYMCLVNPSDAFMLTDQTISNKPAISRRDQAMDGAESEGIRWRACGPAA